jgi:hypothetical protein
VSYHTSVKQRGLNKIKSLNLKFKPYNLVCTTQSCKDFIQASKTHSELLFRHCSCYSDTRGVTVSTKLCTSSTFHPKRMDNQRSPIRSSQFISAVLRVTSRGCGSASYHGQNSTSIHHTRRHCGRCRLRWYMAAHHLSCFHIRQGATRVVAVE